MFSIKYVAGHLFNHNEIIKTSNIYVHTNGRRDTHSLINIINIPYPTRTQDNSTSLSCQQSTQTTVSRPRNYLCCSWRDIGSSEAIAGYEVQRAYEKPIFRWN